ncbi:Serine/threonine-protein kinase [Cryptosporidium felis]|nr:Serine/threonine-protein kinase [Cryptosporidium felis]
MRRSSFSRSPSPEEAECQRWPKSQPTQFERVPLEARSLLPIEVNLTEGYDPHKESQGCQEPSHEPVIESRTHSEDEITESEDNSENSTEYLPAVKTTCSSKSNPGTLPEYKEPRDRDFGEIEDMFASDPDEAYSKNTKLPDNPVFKRLECDDEEGYYVSYIGEIIGDRYKVSSNSTGKGVFSSVVRCLDMETRNEVAIKIIRLNDMMRSTGEKEYSIVRQFRGTPNVVQALGSFVHQNHLCLVFEWLQGSLKSCIQNISIQNIKKTQELALQIFQGLKSIHEKGLIHADLKPENILIDSERKTIRISDFGSVQYTSEASPASYLVSRFYRAPEIMLGCVTYGQSIDIWSVGCVLYECFVGNVLFKGRTNNDMLKLIMEYKGNIPRKLLNQGVFTKNHFSPCFTQFSWKNPQGIQQIIKNFTPSKSILDNMLALTRTPNYQASDIEQTMVRRFSNLVERCLTLDPRKRITAKQALEHSFFQLK